MTEQTVFTFCWYEREVWEELKRTGDDIDAMDDSYDEWRKNANDAIQEIRAKGQNVQKVQIKMDKLISWCEAEGVLNDSKARARYGGIVAQDRALK